MNPLIYFPNASENVTTLNIFGPTTLETIADIDHTLDELARLGVKAAKGEPALAEPGKWFLFDVFMQAIIPQHYFDKLLVRDNAYIVIPDTLAASLSLERLVATKLYKDAARSIGNQSYLQSGSDSQSKYTIPYLRLLFPSHVLPFGMPLQPGSLPLKFTEGVDSFRASDYLLSTKIKREVDEHIDVYTQQIRPLSNASRLRLPTGTVIDIPSVQEWCLLDLTKLECLNETMIIPRYMRSGGTYIVLPTWATLYSSEDLYKATKNSIST